MIQQSHFDPSDELHERVLELVREFAPRECSLAHTDSMAASITGQILCGTLFAFEEPPNPGMGSEGQN